MLADETFCDHYNRDITCENDIATYQLQAKSHLYHRWILRQERSRNVSKLILSYRCLFSEKEMRYHHPLLNADQD